MDNITEIEDAKEKLKASEERYRRLFETAQDGMLILNAETGKITDANPYIQDLIGYSKEELVGKELWEIGTFKNAVENNKRFQELVEEGYIRYEDLPLKTKDWEETPVEFVSNTYEAGGEKVLQCNIRHISKRKEAEEREEFLHSLLRHYVQNKTQIVKGYLELLKKKDLSDEAKNYVQKAMKAINASDEIIEKVRKLRQIEHKDDIKEIDIDPLLDQISSEYKDQAEKEGIDIGIEGTGCKVEGGPLLKEMFSNLIENSILHSDCDEIRVKTKDDGEECVVMVEDDGKGIPDEIKEKVFDRGFKNGKNAGSGLGMFLVKEIAENYDGNIDIQDSDMGGAKFDIRLKRPQ